MRDDIRQALRSIRKQPGFAAVAILTLAFGIGVNTTIFSLVSALFFQPLRVSHPEQLVVVMQRGEIINVPYGHSYPDYLDYRRSVRAFSDIAAFFPTPVHLSAPGQSAERTWIEVVSPNYFALAGVAPALGVLLRPGEGETAGAAPQVVLSYRYWQRRFGGDRGIVGRPITLNGRAFTVVGIAPDTFTGLSWAMAVSGWVPAGTMGALMGPGKDYLNVREAPMFRLMGRLAPGRSVADARAEIEVVARRLTAAYPDAHKGTRPIVVPENRARPDPSVADYLPVFAIVFVAMVTLVLVIACANVANLLLARAISRQRDLAIRSAIGASRSRLIRLQVVEGLLLAAAAGAVGLVLAHWGGQALSSFTPTGDVPVNTDQPTDWRVYGFTLLISALAGVAAALWPARQASRVNVVDILKDGASSIGGRHRLRNLLVIGQVSLSLVVLVSGGLFLHSLRQMQHLALGFTPDGLLMASVDLGMQQYSDERARRFVDDLIARTEALPGVSSATVVSQVPLDYGLQVADVGIDGVIPGTKDGYLSTAFAVVGPNFVQTAGATLLGGREFDTRDTAASPHVALVNQSMARKLWPRDRAIGKRFRVGKDGDWVEIVGIVADGKYVMLGEEPRPYFYLPFAQHYAAPLTVLVRSAADPAGLAGPLRRVLHDLDRDLPIYNVQTMNAHVRNSAFGLMPLRLGAALAGGQGLIGLLLAVMGLYAVVSYAVSRRTREIGVRMALGADRRDVVRLVVREGMRLTAIGVIVGLIAALALGLVLSRVLYGLQPVDVGVLAAVTALLVGVAALACYLPARRATRVDPLLALRAQ